MITLSEKTKKLRQSLKQLTNLGASSFLQGNAPASISFEELKCLENLEQKNKNKKSLMNLII